MQKLRVLIGEDHGFVRGILVALLRSEFEVVDAVGDGDELIEAAVLRRPDVIVSDLLMPIKDGLSARAELLAKGIEIPFVFITLLEASVISPDAASLSYVHKSDLTNELIRSVRAVASGRTYLSRSFREAWGRGE